MVEHEHMTLWNHASIRVLDIRHMVMREGEELRAFQLPASMFLFAARADLQRSYLGGDVKNDPIWGTLDAARNDRVYVWKEAYSWYYDPIAVLSQTEELADWLAGIK